MHYRLVTFLCLVMLILSGCSNLHSEKKEYNTFADFVNTTDSEIVFSDMNMSKCEDGVYEFSYADNDDNIFLEYELRRKGRIVINGTEYGLDATEDLSSGTVPQLALYDINSDGTDDIILSWKQWRGIKSIVLMSSDEDYSYLPSVTELPVRYTSYAAEYKDGYKLHVSSEEFKVNADMALAKEFIEYDKESANWMYDTNGKVKAEYKGKTFLADADYDIGFYVKDNEVYVCHRAQFENDSFWSGISLSMVYKIYENDYLLEGIYLDEEYLNMGW